MVHGALAYWSMIENNAIKFVVTSKPISSKAFQCHGASSDCYKKNDFIGVLGP